MGGSWTSRQGDVYLPTIGALVLQYDSAAAAYAESVASLTEVAETAELQLLQAKEVLSKLGDMADQELPEFDGDGIDKLLNFLPEGTAPELPVCLQDVEPAPSCLPDYDGIDLSLSDVSIPEIDISQLEQYEMQLEARLAEVERQVSK